MLVQRTGRVAPFIVSVNCTKKAVVHSDCFHEMNLVEFSTGVTVTSFLRATFAAIVTDW